MSFLKRIFGGFFGGERAAPAATAQPSAASAHVSTPAVSAPPAPPKLFIGWNEMIDAQGGIGGYRLLPRALNPGQRITGPALLEALMREQTARYAETRPLLIPLTLAQWQEADFKSAVGRQTFILIEDFPELDAATQQQLAHHIRGSGAKLVAPRRIDQAPLPWDVDALLIDFHAEPLTQLESVVRTVRHQRPALRLFMTEVASWSEHRLCRNLDADFCLGDFATTRDEQAPAGRISESRMVVMEMLNQLRQESDPAALAATAMRDPAVVVKLIDMANSPVYGLPRKIARLEEALMLLGSDALYRWLSITLYHLDANSARDRTILVLSLCRAGLLESLLRERDKRSADELFLLGLLSLLDVMLGIPMPALLANLRLPEKVTLALLRNEGAYAPYLQLAIALERCRLDHAVILAASLQISPAHLVDCYREALSWASAEAPH